MELLKQKKIIYNEDTVTYSHKANIVLCSDKNVVRALGVTIFSFIQHMKTPCVFHIFFNGDLPAEDIKKFQQLSQEHDVPIIIYWLNNQWIEKLESSLLNITITTYYRLLVPYILQSLGIDRVLYVDTDILCTNDVSELFTLDLQQKAAFVEKDATAKPNMRLTYSPTIGMKGTDYFNAGVMLINIDVYVKMDIGRKAITLANTNQYPFMDQDVLNILLEGNVIFDTSYAYNCSMSVRNEELPTNIKIVHFTGGKKPWKIYTSHYGTQYTASWHDVHSWKYAYYKKWRECAMASLWQDIPFDMPKTYHDWRYVANMYRIMGQYKKALIAYGKYLSKKY